MKICAITGFLLAVSAAGLQAAIIDQESFSYSDGPLLGNGGWTITGTSTVNPFAVSGGAVTFANTGQDAYNAFGAVQTLSVLGGIYYSLDLSVATAGAGDYFFHLSDPAGTTSNFYSRLLVKSSGAGYVLGLQETSGTGSAATYGSTVLSFSTTYKVVVAWTSVSGGTANDTMSLYIDPVSGSEGGNPAYATDAWTSATLEPTTLAAFNLRQGGGAAAPTLTVDNVIIASTFAEAAAIPEPAVCAAFCGGLVLTGVTAVRHRRKKSAA